jgi:hypothetical protein
MTDKDLKFTTAENFIEGDSKYKLEDGRKYKPGDYIKVETKEYHQTTHYLNRLISIEDIIEQFGDLPTFEKGLNFDYNKWNEVTKEEQDLVDKVSDFIDEHDYDREEDCWTMSKGGYDVDTEIVDEFTIETK